MKALPAIVVAGSLGAGKTTIVNEAYTKRDKRPPQTTREAAARYTATPNRTPSYG
jgi:signal recognition particle receptor subunit beta